jgi:hypothetical protein
VLVTLLQAGESALSIARERGHSEIVAYLEEAVKEAEDEEAQAERQIQTLIQANSACCGTLLQAGESALSIARENQRGQTSE